MELTAVHVDRVEDLIEEGTPEELEPERVDEEAESPGLGAFSVCVVHLSLLETS